MLFFELYYSFTISYGFLCLFDRFSFCLSHVWETLCSFDLLHLIYEIEKIFTSFVFYVKTDLLLFELNRLLSENLFEFLSKNLRLFLSGNSLISSVLWSTFCKLFLHFQLPDNCLWNSYMLLSVMDKCALSSDSICSPIIVCVRWFWISSDKGLFRRNHLSFHM